MTSIPDEVAAGLESLVSPYGVVAGLIRGAAPRGLHRLSLRGASVGGPRALSGAGRAMDAPSTARLIAIAEAAERYAGTDFPDPTETWAIAADLSGPVLDLDAIPRCSAREYATGRCPFAPFDPAAPMRWLRGLDLATGEPTWLPAVMARYTMPDATRAESFWFRISTGYALHFDPTEALLRGLHEVVERDAIALTWHQMLPLRPLVVDEPSEALRALLDWGDRHFVETYLFDATTDVGVPTVYCLQTADHDERCAQFVGCGTGRTLLEAAEKALLEAVPGRSLLATDEPVKEDLADHSTVLDGARYMAARHRREAFDFLLAGAGARAVSRSDRGPVLPDDSGAALTALVGDLASKGMQVLAVDRTTRELATAGLSAVSVVVPALQPMSLLPYGQFRAHPRLYAAPELMGFRSRTEKELNPWPQPFA